MQGPTPFKWYTIEEFTRITDKTDADKLVMRGYVLQSDVMLGKVRLIPWKHAASNSESPREAQWDTVSKDGPVEIRTRRKFVDHAAFEKPAPLKRRTPAERSKSLAARMMLEIQKAGRLPGENDPRLQAIVGESWKEGEPVTGEAVLRVANHFLQQSENQKKRRDFKRVTSRPN